MPAIFTEAVLEQAIIDKFKAEDYRYTAGDDLHRELTDVLIEEDLKAFLKAKYAPEGITDSEVDSIIRSMRYASPVPVYSANKAMFLRMVDTPPGCHCVPERYACCCHGVQVRHQGRHNYS